MVPNFDGMWEKDIQEWLRENMEGKRSLAAKLFGGKPKGSGRAAESLRAYAWNKLVAMRLRREGNIHVALQYEDMCDRIYSRLPSYARW